MKEKTQLSITIIVVAVICYLTIVQILSQDAFIGIATYMVKKAFDGMEKEQESKEVSK